MIGYLYESHLGSFYTSEELYDEKKLYCSVCGDSDVFLGEFKTLGDIYRILDFTYGIENLYLNIFLNREFPDLPPVLNQEEILKYKDWEWHKDKGEKE